VREHAVAVRRRLCGRRWLLRGFLCWVLSWDLEAGDGEELLPGRAWTVAAIGVVDVVQGSTNLRGVGKQFNERRLVGDQRAHLLGLPAAAPGTSMVWLTAMLDMVMSP